MAQPTVNKWVKAEFRRRYGDEKKLPALNFDKLRNELQKIRPNDAKEITAALKRMDDSMILILCSRFPLDGKGLFQNRNAVIDALSQLRPGLPLSAATYTVKKVEQANFKSAARLASPTESQGTNLEPAQQVRSAAVQSSAPKQPQQAKPAIAPQNLLNLSRLTPPIVQGGVPIQSPVSDFAFRMPSSSNLALNPPYSFLQPSDDLLAKKLRQIQLADNPRDTPPSERASISVGSDDESLDSKEEVANKIGRSSSRFGRLMTKKRANMILGGESDDQGAQVRHAPLLSGKTIEAAKTDLVPQYGFLGEKITVDTGHSDPLIFINTNTPFSAFICGVQGSGKSHTTSCILENALIRSCEIGELKSPLSALVFSFGDFNVDGAGFSISEAAFLAMPHSDFPGHPSVKKVTIMVPPSNPALARLYRRIPNVKVIPFKLKPETLGIGTLLTLMAVNQSDSTPLYMAQVTKILREIALEHEGRFDYAYFKKKIDLCDFNPTQLNMLTMRLDLLESFLDLDNSCPAPTFQPGEVTIMDMSCPFVDANTACVLFKIGLQVYLQSKAPGKMIVLDEAHKYMLEVPGAKALNDYLLAIIRLQRHYGARVIVSTQEPVLLTDLIALCSITVIHRFFSPEWFAALKKHIPMAGHDHIELMQKIEQLATGHALIYSSNAVLGQNEDGSLIKGTGKLIEVEIRSRVTSDGGQSVLCVDEV